MSLLKSIAIANRWYEVTPVCNVFVVTILLTCANANCGELTVYEFPEQNIAIGSPERSIGEIEIDHDKQIVRVNVSGPFGPSGKVLEIHYALDGDVLTIDSLGEPNSNKSSEKKLKLRRPGDDELRSP